MWCRFVLYRISHNIHDQFVTHYIQNFKFKLLYRIASMINFWPIIYKILNLKWSIFDPLYTKFWILKKNLNSKFYWEWTKKNSVTIPNSNRYSIFIYANGCYHALDKAFYIYLCKWMISCSWKQNPLLTHIFIHLYPFSYNTSVLS